MMMKFITCAALAAIFSTATGRTQPAEYHYETNIVHQTNVSRVLCQQFDYYGVRASDGAIFNLGRIPDHKTNEFETHIRSGRYSAGFATVFRVVGPLDSVVTVRHIAAATARLQADATASARAVSPQLLMPPMPPMPLKQKPKTASVLPSGPHLSIYFTNLADPVAQPTSGTWSNLTLQLPADGGSGTISVFCQKVVAVNFPTEPVYFYQCQASDDNLQTWLPGATIAGTGDEMTLYDTPRERRFYRVLQSSN